MKDFESERNFTRSGYEYAKVINAVELAELAAENDKTCSALRWTEWTVCSDLPLLCFGFGFEVGIEICKVFAFCV